jgi:hypothetical protein
VQVGLQRGATAVAGLAQVPELVQHRAVLDQHQQQ